MEKKQLTRDQILGADDIRTETVEVPEWVGTVGIKVLSGTERDTFEIGITTGHKEGGPPDIRAMLCARAIVNEKGGRMFTDADVSALGRKSGAALDRVFQAVKKLNAMTEEDIKELEKNSGTVQGDDSDSD